MPPHPTIEDVWRVARQLPIDPHFYGQIIIEIKAGCAESVTLTQTSQRPPQKGGQSPPTVQSVKPRPDT